MPPEDELLRCQTTGDTHPSAGTRDGGIPASGGRDVAIDPSTVAALRRQSDRQLADAAKFRDAWQATGYVFTIENGQPIHPERVSKAFAVAVHDAITKAAAADPTNPLPPIRLHDLRHTHATLALRARVPVKVVSQRLGHKSTRITEDIYQHVLREQQDDAAAQIAGLVLAAAKPTARLSVEVSQKAE